jgi:hypothetical protein
MKNSKKIFPEEMISNTSKNDSSTVAIQSFKVPISMQTIPKSESCIRTLVRKKVCAKIISNKWFRYLQNWANVLLPFWQPETYFIQYYTSLPFGILLAMGMHKMSTQLTRSILRLVLVFINLILTFGLRSFNFDYLSKTGNYFVHFWVRLILTLVFTCISMPILASILPFNRDDERPPTRI